VNKSSISTILALIGFAAGCASNPDRATDSSAAASNQNPDGILVVYSAPDPYAHFNGSPYNLRYSDYTVCSAGGAALQTVHNGTGTMLEGPARVHLPPGKYKVKGRSLSQLVTVSVEITAHQVTTVHLN